MGYSSDAKGLKNAKRPMQVVWLTPQSWKGGVIMKLRESSSFSELLLEVILVLLVAGILYLRVAFTLFFSPVQVVMPSSC
jgi:hypothetical protein